MMTRRVPAIALTLAMAAGTATMVSGILANTTDALPALASNPTSTSTAVANGTGILPASSPGAVQIAAVGDMNPPGNVATTSPSGKNATAITEGLSAGTLDAFFGLGDFQYDIPYCADYVNYWQKLWGGTKSKLYWVAGPNHDWQPGRNEDLDNFMDGQCPGDTTKSAINSERGFIGSGDPYSRDFGNWHVVFLPSALWPYDTQRANQVTVWLDNDLATAKGNGKHLAVVYHDPYFTSDTYAHTRAGDHKPWIDVMYKHRVRLTLSGSQHNYERSCPVNNADQCVSDGMTAFQVSTGGRTLRPFASSPTYIAKRFSDTHGWLQLTLRTDGSFEWNFHPVIGGSTDSGMSPAPANSPSPPPVDVTAPVVSSVSPGGGATGVSASTKVSATFSEDVDASTVTSSTFTLAKGSAAVAAGVGYDSVTQTATLTPGAVLDPATTYTVSVRGTANGVKDKAGNPLASDKVWQFTTAAATVTLNAVADTFATSSAATTAQGAATTMRVDAVPVDLAYLRFDLAGYAGRTVQSATLHLRTGSNASAAKQAVKLVTDDSWAESGLTYNNRPALGSTSLGTVGPTQINSTAVVALAASAVQTQASGDGKISLGLDQTVDDGLTLVTKEGGTPPKLVLTFSG